MFKRLNTLKYIESCPYRHFVNLSIVFKQKSLDFYNFKFYSNARKKAHQIPDKIILYSWCTSFFIQNPAYHEVISWDYDGESIIIKDHLKMANSVIPEHFSLKQFSSFVRQLHLYDFHKKKSSSGCLVFENSCFLKEKRD